MKCFVENVVIMLNLPSINLTELVIKLAGRNVLIVNNCYDKLSKHKVPSSTNCFWHYKVRT